MVAQLCDIKLEEVVVADKETMHKLSAGNSAFTLPCLETEEGEIISQTQAIVDYLAFDHKELLGKS